jgi:tetratricopeptide (TPR) repeat protein
MGKRPRRWPVLTVGVSEYPENLLLLYQRSFCLYELQRWEEAREAQLKLLAREGLPANTRGHLLNTVAYTDAILGREELLPEADHYSLEAMGVLGGNPAVKGTRGTVLVLLRKIQEGLTLLHESLEQTDDPKGKAENSCWMAMGHAWLGELAEALKRVKEARRLQPDCFLLERAERAVLLSVDLGAESAGGVGD